MIGISTHVLDTSRGRPAAGIPVTLAALTSEGWTDLAHAKTDADGRVANLVPPSARRAKTYRLRFDVAEYFAAQSERAFYPQVEVTFTPLDDGHHHVPLLLTPFGYTTYRGS